MAHTVTQDSVDAAFNRFVRNGKALGIFSPNAHVWLQNGTKSAGVTNSIGIIDSDGMRPMSGLPFLGFTKRDFFDTLHTISAAWELAEAASK